MATDINPSRQHVYLTFDDDPLNGSQNAESVIAEEEVNVSMLIVGKHAQQSTLLASYLDKYRHNPSIEVYNHSYSHANSHYKLFYSRPKNVLADINKNESLLGLHHKIVRLPGRNMWRIGNRRRNDIVSGSVAADLVAKNGYKIYGWDLEWRTNSTDNEPVESVDAMEKTIVQLLNSSKTFTPNHLVLLAHDPMFQLTKGRSQLKQLIDRLRTHPDLTFSHIRSYPDNKV